MCELCRGRECGGQQAPPARAWQSLERQREVGACACSLWNLVVVVHTRLRSSITMQMLPFAQTLLCPYGAAPPAHFTWGLHLGGVPGCPVVDGQDAEGVDHSWVQPPQAPVAGVGLDVASGGFPGAGHAAGGFLSLAPLHHEAGEVAGALRPPLQPHLGACPRVPQLADGDVGGGRVPCGEMGPSRRGLTPMHPKSPPQGPPHPSQDSRSTRRRMGRLALPTALAAAQR